MKNKLEVGMYVRYKNGIGKIVAKYVKGVLLDKGKGGYFRTESIDILKASHNIIDLIEVGDYLNGFKVSKIERYDTNTIIKIGNSTFNVLEGEKIYTPSYDNNNGYEKIEKLKSIITKEQMEQMEYKVVE